MMPLAPLILSLALVPQPGDPPASTSPERQLGQSPASTSPERKLGSVPSSTSPERKLGSVPSSTSPERKLGSASPQPPPLATSTVGIEGRVLLRVPTARSLVTLPVERATPVVLRIADYARDGDAVIYDLRFIAQYPGAFDLRDYLQYGDGTPATDLAPIPVEVGSLLPESHTGDLFEIGGLALPSLGGYRALLIAAGAVWLLPIGWVVAKRLRRSPAPAPVYTGPPRTLGDQLRPLLEAAIAGSLSTERSAELEMLLLAYWRRHRRIEHLSHKAAIAALRDDAEAGELLRSLDRWLHQPPSDAASVDLNALLSPYRDIEPIELPAPASTSPERKLGQSPASTSPERKLGHSSSSPNINSAPAAANADTQGAPT